MKKNIFFLLIIGIILVQGSFAAKAISRTEIGSNYKSPPDQFKSREVKFKNQY